MKHRLFFPSILIATIALLNYQVQAQKTWNLSGNSNASASSKLGTTNSVPLGIFTNNAERIHIDVSGNVGIGTTYPVDKLHVEGIGLFTQGITASNGGIIGYNTGGVGLYGEGTTYGVYAVSRNVGVLGSSNSGGHGIDGWSSYLGVYGNGGTYGVYGAGGTYGVYGAGSAYGVYGNNSNGIGIVGNSTNYLGGYFYSANYYGISAGTGLSSKNWAGVFDGNLLPFGTYQTSDKNLKKNIEDITDALSISNNLKPRSYEFRKDGKLASLNLPQGKHYGLIAQDLEEVLPDLVKEVENVFPPNAEPKPVLSPEPNGKDVTLPPPAKETVTPAPQQLEKSEKMSVKAVNYIELIPILIKALQDQQQQIRASQHTVSKFTQPQSTNASAGSEMLGQNTPNPVRDVTKIQFGLLQGSNNAQLVITDNLGRVVKSLRLTASGMVNVDVSSFGNGVYNYSLVIDNKTLQTKKMTVVK